MLAALVHAPNHPGTQLPGRLQPYYTSSVPPYMGDNTHDRRAMLSAPGQNGVALEKRGTGVDLTYETPHATLGWAPYMGDNTYDRRASLSAAGQNGVALEKRGSGIDLTYETPHAMMGWEPHFGDNTYDRRAMLNRR